MTLNVLLIEDSPTVTAMLSAELAQYPHKLCKLSAATTLKEGLEQLATSVPDIVLLDLHLPDSDGLQTLESVKAVVPFMPIVIHTGTYGYELAVSAVHTGAEDFVLKSECRPGQLLKTILVVLARRRRASSLDANKGRAAAAAASVERLAGLVSELEQALTK